MLHTTSRPAIGVLLAILPTIAYADLIHYQPFDDGATATLANYGTAGGTSTTTTYSGSTPSSTTSAAAGLGPYAETFPQAGSTSRGGAVVVSNSSSTFTLDQAGSAMTISLWLKWDGNGNLASGRQGLVAKMNSSQNQGWALSVMTTGLLRFDFTGASNGNRGSTTAVTTGAWTHVAVVFASGSANSLKFYINGVDAGISNGLTGIVIANSSENIRIGSFLNDYSSANGTMDDVAMWNSSLTTGKVAAIAHAPTVLSGYGADDMQSLFTVYDDATGATQKNIGDRTWQRATGLTGHAAGDVWSQDGSYFMQLDSSGAGVSAAAPIPEPAAVGLLGVGGLAAMGSRIGRRHNKSGC